MIDTSHIYKYDNLPRATPALADLAECVLKKPIRQGGGAKHSPVEDAQTAVELALHQVRGTHAAAFCSRGCLFLPLCLAVLLCSH